MYEDFNSNSNIGSGGDKAATITTATSVATELVAANEQIQQQQKQQRL